MATFHSMFELCAQENPTKNAILYCDNTETIHSITYSELINQINIVAVHLSKNITENICVGILMETNYALPALILSIQKHDCPFYCFHAAICKSTLCSIIKKIGITYIFIQNTADNLKLITSCSSFICDLELNQIKLSLWKTNINYIIYKNISYIIQTSGTTGQNKIVKVQNNCIISNVISLRKVFDISNEDVIYLGTPVTFDPFIIEFMLALTTGACLFIVSPSIKHNKKRCLKILFPEINFTYSGVTFMQMPPSVLFSFSEQLVMKILCENTSLRILALGGELFPRQLLYKYKNWSKSLRIFNLYGITEVSCWASYQEVFPDQESISLGTTLDETIFEIRNNSGNVVIDGEGNLFVGSETRICIIDDENIIKDKIIFRDTGDIVKIDKNKIFYVGRKNNIIKRLGHKVNLTFIEKSVYDKTDLTSVCVWNENKSKLILFIILQEIDNMVKNKIIDKLRIKLLRTLPSECMPDLIEIIPSIPLTSNGKTDRNYLLQIANMNNESLSCLHPIEIFENLWSKYFGKSKIEINEQKNYSFLYLGGNSILAIQLISDFDSIVNNTYSGELMTLLLDPNKNYVDYTNFINSKKSNNNSDYSVVKRIKLSESIYEANTNIFKINAMWTHNLDGCVDSSPVCFIHPRLGSLIAVGSHGQKFVILKAITGKIVSEIVLPDAVEGSACITEDKEIAIIGCNDGYMYYINIENSCVINKFKTNSYIKCTPVLYDNKIIFGSYDKFIYCINLQGILIWKMETQESIKSNVIIKDNNSYVATIQGTFFCICVKTGLLIWRSKSNVPVFGSPCSITDEHIIVWANVKGNVICFDCDNGDKLWTYEAASFIYSSFCETNKNLIFSCFDHNVYCLECTRNNCKEVFKVNIAGQSSTTPCLLNINNNKYIFTINNKGLLRIIDFENLKLQQTFQLPAEVFSSPTFIDNLLYFGCRDNNLYCIELKINT